MNGGGGKKSSLSLDIEEIEMNYMKNNIHQSSKSSSEEQFIAAAAAAVVAESIIGDSASDVDEAGVVAISDDVEVYHHEEADQLAYSDDL